MTTKGVVLWRGPSTLDFEGASVVALATFRSTNRKTGDMVQTWMLCEDVAPMRAVSQNLDVAVCGSCPLRGNGFKRRACYVNMGTAPGGIWKAYHEGHYPPFEEHMDLFVGRWVRWGAYGDPVVIPFEIVDRINKVADGWTGYTHQWRTCDQRFRDVMMASVEDETYAEAKRLGWRTFRATTHEELESNEALCYATTEGKQCIDCGQCSGGRGQDIAIAVHGKGRRYFSGQTRFPFAEDGLIEG